MKASPFLLLILAAVIFGGLTQAPLRAEEREKTVDQWIEQLRSEDFDQRQVAAKKLESIGDVAREALEKAAKDDDADLRATAVKLLAKLSQATLALRVFDADGKPVSNADGEILFNDPASNGQNPLKSAPVKLDGEGRASLKLHAFGDMNFQIKAKGFIETGTWVSLHAHNGVNPVVVTVSRGGNAAGSVVGDDGKPIKDANVLLIAGAHFEPELFELQLQSLTQNNPTFGDEGSSLKTQTDNDGKWRAENLAESVYTPVVQAEGHAPAMGEMIRVREGQTVSAAQIALKTRASGKLEFKLKKADGSPLPKRSVDVLLTPVFSGPKKEQLQAIGRSLPANQQQKESDENGNVEIADLAPGTYRLVVSTEPAEGEKNEGGILIQSEIEIKSGETARVEQKKMQKLGSIRGKILSENGKGLRDMRVHVYEQEALLESLDNPSPETPFGRNSQTEVDTNNKGAYVFDKLPPGKYALTFKPNSDNDDAHQNYIFGIEVESGKKTAHTPEAVLKSTASSSAPTTLKGRVLLPDGSPAKRAELQYLSSHTNTSCGSNDDGTFEFLAARPKPGAVGEKTHEYFAIRCPGCKPLVVEGPLDVEKDYRLEAQEYGSLRVTVTDEKGKLLPGVKVSPSGAANNNSNVWSRTPFGMETHAHAQGAITNVKGVARLTGLAVGRREITISYPGYWLPPKDSQFELTANVEKELTLALRPGVTISGRVHGPGGAAAPGAMGMLNNNRFEPAGADGTFSFTGIVPGEYYISAWAPGYVAAATVKLSLPHDPEKLNAAIKDASVVELVRPGGIAINCGKVFAGRSAQLEPFNPDTAQTQSMDYNQSGGGVIDITGRAEFWGIVPGKYKLTLAENDFLSMAENTRKVPALPSAGPFEVKELASREKLATLEAVKTELKQGTGSVTGRIRMDAQAAWSDSDSGFSISLKIAGDAATATTELGDPIESYWQPFEPPQVFGKAPESFKPRIPGSFEVVALPPGEYKVYASENHYDTGDVEGPSPTHDPKPKPIGAFTIKAGEKVDLGELKLEIQEPPTPGKQNPALKNMLRPYDKVQEFEP